MVRKGTAAKNADKENMGRDEEEHGMHFHHPWPKSSPDTTTVMGPRRSTRSTQGNGGRIAQFQNIERIQTQRARREVNSTLHSQPINVLAPQALNMRSKAKIPSHLVKDQAAGESGLQQPGTGQPLKPKRYLAKPGERYGFVRQREDASDRPQVGDKVGESMRANDEEDDNGRTASDDEDGPVGAGETRVPGADDSDDEGSQGPGQANGDENDEDSSDSQAMDIDNDDDDNCE